jgi:hypothetical protein
MLLEDVIGTTNDSCLLSRVKENMDKGLILREISRWLTNGETSNGFISFNDLLCLMLSLNDFLIWWNNILLT